MATIKILIEGYARELPTGWQASSTSCLITTDNYKIITDPGCNRQALLAALDREDLSTDAIDYVFLSHRHPDHTLLACLFERAKYVTFDAHLLYDNDVMLEFDKHLFGEDIEIIDTPGHVQEHLSLLVQTQEGKIAIAGDVFWWLDGETQLPDLNQEDPSQASDMDHQALMASRKKLLAWADYIIPGHGKRFKVDR